MEDYRVGAFALSIGGAVEPNLRICVGVASVRALTALAC